MKLLDSPVAQAICADYDKLMARIRDLGIPYGYSGAMHPSKVLEALGLEMEHMTIAGVKLTAGIRVTVRRADPEPGFSDTVLVTFDLAHGTYNFAANKTDEYIVVYPATKIESTVETTGDDDSRDFPAIADLARLRMVALAVAEAGHADEARTIQEFLEFRRSAVQERFDATMAAKLRAMVDEAPAVAVSKLDDVFSRGTRIAIAAIDGDVQRMFVLRYGGVEEEPAYDEDYVLPEGESDFCLHFNARPGRLGLPSSSEVFHGISFARAETHKVFAVTDELYAELTDLVPPSFPHDPWPFR